MALFLKHTVPLIGVWKIEESTEELLALLEQKENYLPFITSVTMEKRRQEWLAVRVLLKELLGKETPIAYYPNGMPYLPDVPLCISISHTQGFAAVLLQESPVAGIDIEYRSERILKTRERFLGDKEVKAVDRNNEIEHSLIYWCAKETLFKMIGQEDVDFRDHLHVQAFPYASSGVLSVYETRTHQASVYSLNYLVESDFVLVWNR